MSLKTACGRTFIAWLFLVVLPAVAQAQYQYTVHNGKVTITKYTGPGGAVTIPSTIQGLPVYIIGVSAFSNNTALTSVTIPHGVIYLRDNAFYGCTNLSRVTIPDSVTHIGWATFFRCTSLKTLHVPDSVISMADCAFQFSGLTRFSIPNNITNLRYHLFSNCSNLVSVTVPKSVRYLDRKPFKFCTRLRGVYFQGNAPAYGVDPFNSSSNVTVYYARGTKGWGPTYAGRRTAPYTPGPSLFLSPMVQPVRSTGGAAIFSVANHGGGTMRYAASETSSWMNIVSKLGTNSGRITVYCANNPTTQGRTGIVTVTSSGALGSPKIVKVVQPGNPELRVTPATQSVGGGAGRTIFAVTNGGGWPMRYAASETSSWLSITYGANGTNRGVLVVSHLSNPYTFKRTGTVVVASSGAIGNPRRIQIVQDGSPGLVVMPSVRSVSRGAGTTTFVVTNWGGWRMVYTSGWASAWMNVSGGRIGTNSGTVSISYSANPYTSSRTGTFWVTSGGAISSPKSVRVVQAGSPALLVTPSIQWMGPESGEATFSVANSGGWTMAYSASVSDSWLSFSGESSGTNSGTITVMGVSNPTADPRTGLVTVVASGAIGSPKSVKVVQAGWPGPGKRMEKSDLPIVPGSFRMLDLAPAADSVKTLSGPSMVIRWPSLEGEFYTVFRSTNLLEGFGVIRSNIPATPPVNHFIDPDPPGRLGTYSVGME